MNFDERQGKEQTHGQEKEQQGRDETAREESTALEADGAVFEEIAEQRDEYRADQREPA